MPNSEALHKSKSVVLSRREALKALVAATGAVALSNLPQSWKTPIIEVGVLPAHAQGASGPAPVVNTVSGYWVNPQSFSNVKTKQMKAPPSCTVVVTFNYQDTLGQVSTSSVVQGTYATVEGFNGTVILDSGSTGYNGSITFPFNSSTCINSTAPISLRMLVQGRYSNVSNGVIDPPPA